MKPDILVICGPTASGKTALAAALARRFGGEVVSADSMQVYRGMDIGTAKPTRDETLGVPHHMLDVADPSENYSVARYVAEAVPIVDDILARGKLPIVAGGTGLYIDHLVAGRQFAPFEADSGLREELQARVRSEGLAALRLELEQVDPEAAARIHPNDEKRTVRALEVYLSTGKTITQHDRESREVPPRYTPLTIALNFQERPWLWERIDRRVDEMMERGLEQEVRRLLADGVPRDCTAMQAIGYKELAAAILEGRPVSNGAEEVKLRSRQYAKRQLTWFRRDRQAHWFQWEKIPDFSAALAFSTELVTGSGLQ
ncbi:MAG: tRNA (adenosine(37)-N6)-dimethylallyltransferase MiaA [Oscillospiraceae bacterium]|nr:tRNA (adenosine(37)-N6)-dimethylallyltransferase MiaA [Oscillospiraceae bacterium]MDE7172328.1 tRNA (adenosine(37)-N6)-dimethylallyltransferase MiaA [Oscillospiraceae bacterium]